MCPRKCLSRWKDRRWIGRRDGSVWGLVVERGVRRKSPKFGDQSLAPFISISLR